MTFIKFLNMHEAMHNMTRSLEDIKKAQKTARSRWGSFANRKCKEVPPHIIGPAKVNKY